MFQNNFFFFPHMSAVKISKNEKSSPFFGLLFFSFQLHRKVWRVSGCGFWEEKTLLINSWKLKTSFALFFSWRNVYWKQLNWLAKLQVQKFFSKPKTALHKNFHFFWLDEMKKFSHLFLNHDIMMIYHHDIMIQKKMRKLLHLV